MNVNKTKIPLPFECVSVEYPYIGSTKDVYDDELHKTQRLINVDLLNYIREENSTPIEIEIDDAMSLDSVNPVQNKIITAYIIQKISRLEQLLTNYQEILVNLSNIKSINNKSLLGSGNILLFEVLTLEEYDSLDNISKDTLYLIVEESGDWGFGDEFPITLSDNSTFPIILS